MAGIEVVFAMVIFIMGTIGLVRGPAREVGVTMALVVLLAVLSQFDNLIPIGQMPGQVNNTLRGFGLGSDDPMQQRTMVWFLFTAATAFTAFLAYHGHETLKFSFQDPRGIGGVILGWLAGAINGYLIAGTSWYYLDRLGYPVQRYDWFAANFTNLAQGLVRFLPQNLASGVILSAFALGLLWWRILR